MLRRIGKRTSSLILAVIVTMMPFISSLNGIAESVTTEKINLFVPNTCTYDENGNVISSTLSTDCESYIVEKNFVEVKRVLDGGWSGTADHPANPNGFKAYMLSAVDTSKPGYAIFKMQVPTGKMYQNVSLTINARNCMGNAVFYISDKQDGIYKEIYQPAANASGIDTKVDISQYAAGLTEIYIKACFPQAMYVDFCALYSMTAEVSYVDYADILHQPKSLLEADFTKEDWETQAVISAKNNLQWKVWWPDFGYSGIMSKPSADGLSSGSSYVIYKLENPTQGYLSLSVKNRSCTGVPINFYISTSGEGYTKVGSVSTDNFDKNTVATILDVGVADKGAFFIKAEISGSNCYDWGVLQYLKVESTPTSDPVTISDNETLLDVDFGDENFNEQWPAYETVNMYRDFCDYYNGMMNIPTNKDAGPACKEGYITYHFSQVKAGYVTAYITHRACMNVPVIVEYSDDGTNFTTVSTISDAHLNAPAEIDLSSFALGATDFYLKFRVPGSMCYDWGAIRSIRVVNEKADIERLNLMDVNYAQENWASQYPPETQNNLHWGFTEDGYGVMANKNSSGSSSNEAYVTYKFTGVNAQKLLLYSKNRSCADVSVLYEYSTDGSNFTTMLDQKVTHKDATFELDITKYAKDLDTFYIRVRIPGSPCYDWGCLYALKLVALRGNIKLYYQVDANTNEGGSVESPGKVIQGEELTVTAHPDTDYTFLGWFNMTGSKLSSDSSYTFKPESDMTINAKFRKNYTGDGQVVLYNDFNDEQMQFIGNAAATENLDVTTDPYLSSVKKYGVSLVKFDPAKDASLTYHFTGMTDLNTFKAVTFGRGVQGMTVTFQYSEDNQTWQDVKTLGGKSVYAWNFTEKEINFTDFITDSDFYIRVRIDQGGLQNWLTLSRLIFVKNGTVKSNDYDVQIYPEGRYGNLLTGLTAAPSTDVTFGGGQLVLHTYSNRNLKETAEGLQYINSADSADVVWKLESTGGLASVQVALRGTTSDTIYLRYSIDGVEWRKIAFLKADSMGRTYTISSENSSNITGTKTIYIRATCTGTTTITGIQVITSLFADHWLEKEDGWHYYDQQGLGSVGLQSIGNNSYFFNENGILQKGWIEISGNWYYFGEDGAMKRSTWIDAEEGRRCVDENGRLVTGWTEIDGAQLYFGKESGLQLSDGLLIDGEDRYFLQKDGQPVSSGWIQYHERMYGFDSNGQISKALVAVLEQPASFSADNLPDGRIQLSWAAVPGAEGYQILDTGSQKMIGETQDNRFIIDNPEAGVSYSLQVRAFNEAVVGSYSLMLQTSVTSEPTNAPDEEDESSVDPDSKNSSSENPSVSESSDHTPSPSPETGENPNPVPFALGLLIASGAVAGYTIKKKEDRQEQN